MQAADQPTGEGAASALEGRSYFNLDKVLAKWNGNVVSKVFFDIGAKAVILVLPPDRVMLINLGEASSAATSFSLAGADRLAGLSVQPAHAVQAGGSAGDGPLWCVWRDGGGVELLRAAAGGRLEPLHSEAARARAPLLGAYWTFGAELLAVSAEAVQLSELGRGLVPGSRTLRLLKEHRLRTAHHVYSSAARLLVLALQGPPPPSAFPPALAVFYVKPGLCVRVAKVEPLLDVPALLPNAPEALQPVVLYGRQYVGLLGARGCQLLLLQATQTELVRRHALDLFLPASRVALAAVDNLLLVQHRDAQLTVVFDIKEADGAGPLAPPLPLPRQPYGSDWLYADGSAAVLHSSAGEVREMRLQLEALLHAIDDPLRQVRCLLRRAGPQAKAALLALVRRLICTAHPLPLLAAIFDVFNFLLAAQPAHALGDPLPPPLPLPLPPPASPLSPRPGSDAPGVAEGEVRKTADGHTIVDQTDLYRHVFLVIEERQQQLALQADALPQQPDARAYAEGTGRPLDVKYRVGVLVEYLRSLNFHRVVAEHFIYELLIDLLMRTRRFALLHQFLQYHVLSDSQPVAFQLLSLEPTYPPAGQLALDMLKRLSSPEEVVEVLLTRHALLPALRVLRAHPQLRVSPLRFLETAAALLARDRASAAVLYATVYTFFEERGQLPTAGVERFTSLYRELAAPPPEQQIVGDGTALLQTTAN